MTPVGRPRCKLEFLVPARGLFGYRNEFLTDTKGEGIMASVFDCYAPYQGRDLSRRNAGALVAFETGECRHLRPVSTPRSAARCSSAPAYAGV